MRRAALVAALALGCASCADDRVGCTDCAIEVERTATFGDADGDAALAGMVATIIRDSHRRLLVGAFNADRILVFDSTGRFLRVFGRAGEGPGEFGGTIRSIVRTRGDSLVVYDAGNDRLASFSRDFEPGWTAPDVLAYGGGSLIALPQGGFVRSGESGRGANRSPAPMHLLDTAGMLVESFGQDSADATQPGTMYPTLAATPEGHVWAADRSRYRLILWSTDGTPLRTIERSVEWFPPRTSQVRITPEQAPVPAIEAIHLDAENRLWVLIAVAATNWGEGLGEERPGPHGPSHPITDRELVYETMIEVLDAESGKLLASTRVPEIVQMMLEDGLAARYFEDSTGVPRVELLRLHVVE